MLTHCQKTVQNNYLPTEYQLNPVFSTTILIELEPEIGCIRRPMVHRIAEYQHQRNYRRVVTWIQMKLLSAASNTNNNRNCMINIADGVHRPCDNRPNSNSSCQCMSQFNCRFLSKGIVLLSNIWIYLCSRSIFFEYLLLNEYIRKVLMT